VETDLYYLQSRYYNPNWGRFINADVYINANGDLIGFNMFAYCGNNPIMFIDPKGYGIYYDINEPDWASSFLPSEIEIMRVVGFADFNKLDDELQRVLLYYSVTREYMDGWSEATVVSELLTTLPYNKFGRDLNWLLLQNEIVTHPIWTPVPVIGQARKVLLGTQDILEGIQEGSVARIGIGVYKIASVGSKSYKWYKKGLKIKAQRLATY